jgi:hypothetical protein
MKGVEHSFIILLNKKNHILNLLMDEYIRLVLVLPAAPGITDTTLIFFLPLDHQCSSVLPTTSILSHINVTSASLFQTFYFEPHCMGNRIDTTN